MSDSTEAQKPQHRVREGAPSPPGPAQVASEARKHDQSWPGQPCPSQPAVRRQPKGQRLGCARETRSRIARLPACSCTASLCLAGNLGDETAGGAGGASGRGLPQSNSCKFSSACDCAKLRDDDGRHTTEIELRRVGKAQHRSGHSRQKERSLVARGRKARWQTHLGQKQPLPDLLLDGNASLEITHEAEMSFHRAPLPSSKPNTRP